MRPVLFKWRRGKHDLRGRRSLTIWRTVAVLATVAVVMALLGAEPLHRSADLMHPSSLRTVALAVTQAFAKVSDAIHTDWPWQQVAYGEGLPSGEGAGDETPSTGTPSTETSPTGTPSTETSPTGTPTTVSSPAATLTPPTTSGSAAATTSSTTTTLRVTTTTTLPRFTEQHPLRILVVGDSLMSPIGYALMRQSETYPALQVKAITKASTGLVRPDFYNWPQVLGETVAEYHPHVTVVLFGGNEKQVMRYRGQALDPFSDAWNAEYAKRVGQAIEISATAGASVVWLGLPIMRSGKFSETVRTLNAFYSAACAESPAAVYIDGYALFSDPSGKYSAYLVNSAGENQLMRAGDGIHLTDRGGDRMADAIVKVLLTKYRLQ
jgi:hypothetical protein